MLRGQAEALLPMVDAAMREAAMPVAGLDLVAVTIGPGSFTGIRVGLAAAHGIVLAVGLPLVGITGFEAIAACVERGRGNDGRLLLAALESRRSELYVQLFGPDQAIGEPAAVIPEALGKWITALCPAQPLLVAGDAAERAVMALGKQPGATILADRTPAAVGVARAALRRWRAGTALGQTDPLYLRPPDAILPRRSTADGGS
jgi:tRNA threonylcarbamoyladenosine biosynthesis protein TsaB